MVVEKPLLSTFLHKKSSSSSSVSKKNDQNKVNCSTPMISDDEDRNRLNIDETLYLETIAQLKEIKKLGYSLHGDCGNDGQVKPVWFDQQLFDQGKHLGQKYFFSCFFGHLCGLYMLVHVPSIYEPLLTTGNSRDLSTLFARYLSTLNHIKAWYDGDVWDHNDPAYKSIATVRKAHKLVANRLNVGKTEGVDQLALSQYDMFITLWAFCGNTYLHPKETGFPDDPAKIKAWIHFWRVIGYLLGVDDKYNICNDEDMDRVTAMMQVVWDQELKPLLVDIDPKKEKGRIMCDSIIESIRSIVPTMSTPAFIKYFHEMHQLQSPVKLETTGARFGHTMMKLTMASLLPSAIAESVVNFLLNRRIVRCNRNQSRIQKSLVGKGTINEPDQNTVDDLNETNKLKSS